MPDSLETIAPPAGGWGDVLTEAGACAYLAHRLGRPKPLARRTLARYRAQGQLEARFVLGRVQYRRAELDRFIAEGLGETKRRRSGGRPKARP